MSYVAGLPIVCRKHGVELETRMILSTWSKLTASSTPRPSSATCVATSSLKSSYFACARRSWCIHRITLTRWRRILRLKLSSSCNNSSAQRMRGGRESVCRSLTAQARKVRKGRRDSQQLGKTWPVWWRMSSPIGVREAAWCYKQGPIENCSSRILLLFPRGLLRESMSRAEPRFKRVQTLTQLTKIRTKAATPIQSKR